MKRIILLAIRAVPNVFPFVLIASILLLIWADEAPNRTLGAEAARQRQVERNEAASVRFNLELARARLACHVAMARVAVAEADSAGGNLRALRAVAEAERDYIRPVQWFGEDETCESLMEDVDSEEIEWYLAEDVAAFIAGSRYEHTGKRVEQPAGEQ